LKDREGLVSYRKEYKYNRNNIKIKFINILDKVKYYVTNI